MEKIKETPLAFYFIFVVIFSLILTFIFNAIFAQTMQNIISATNASNLIYVIIYSNFLISIFSSFIGNVVISTELKMTKILYVSLFTIIIVIFVQIVVSYFYVYRAYPSIFPTNTDTTFLSIIILGLTYIAIIPKVTSYFILYFVNDLSIFFVFVMVLYNVIYIAIIEIIQRVQRYD